MATSLDPVTELSIVLPAYNEAGNIAAQIQDIITTFKKYDCDYELIVVNDGSGDETLPVLRALAKKISTLKIVNHATNEGYGAALRSGFRQATKHWIFLTDADRQFNIEEIGQFMAMADHYDLIIGYRVRRQDNAMRRLNAWLWHGIVYLLLGLNIKDVDCAFKLFKREIIERIELGSSGALISTELLVGAKRLKYKVKELPVSHYPRQHGQSTGANPKVIIRALRELLLFKFTGHVINSD